MWMLAANFDSVFGCWYWQEMLIHWLVYWDGGVGWHVLMITFANNIITVFVISMIAIPGCKC